MGPVLTVIAVVLAGAALRIIVAPRKKREPFRLFRRRFKRFRPATLPTKKRRPRLALSIPKVFESGEVDGNADDDVMASMILGGDIPGGRVAYVVDVVGKGDDVSARGRFRAVIQTDDAGVTEIVFGAIMPKDASRQLGLAEYLVDATRGTVGFAGFSFWEGEKLMFNVRGVETAGPYRVEIRWRGIELD